MSALLMNRASTKEAILAAEGKRPGVSPAESESSAVKGSSPSDPNISSGNSSHLGRHHTRHNQ
jgi:hypothetical protein